MIITIIGTHGTGKTTLSYLMASYYKKQGKNVKIIQETARNCPFPLNEKMTIETCLWIYHEHSKKELEAKRNHDIVICDRSSFDSFVYAKNLNLFCDNFDNLYNSALHHLKTAYNKVILVKPDIPLVSDGIRSSDHSFQFEIDLLFEQLTKNVPLTRIFSSDIISESQKWKNYCT